MARYSKEQLNDIISSELPGWKLAASSVSRSTDAVSFGAASNRVEGPDLAELRRRYAETPSTFVDTSAASRVETPSDAVSFGGPSSATDDGAPYDQALVKIEPEHPASTPAGAPRSRKVLVSKGRVVAEQG